MKVPGMAGVVLAVSALMMGGFALFAPAQPKTNIWVTLANATGQDTICLAQSSPGNPFTTCLVGVPIPEADWPQPTSNFLNLTADTWDQVAVRLPLAPQEPQELDILGSLQASACVNFNYTSTTQKEGNNYTNIVNPTQAVFQNQTAWCNRTSRTISLSTSVPLQLPKGLFFICGDRA